MVKELPKFKGYTVDERLKQFRKVDREKPSIEFVDFDSEKGKKLLDEYEEIKKNKTGSLLFLFLFFMSPSRCRMIL